MALHLALQTFRRAIVLPLESLPDFGDNLVGIGIVDNLVRTTSPQSNVVERQHVFLNTAIDDGALLSVADNQRLFEVTCRPVVVQTQLPAVGHSRSHTPHHGKHT